MDLPGSYRQIDGGYECTECGELIEVGERAIRVDYAEVGRNDAGRPRVFTQNFGGIFHPDCI